MKYTVTMMRRENKARIADNDIQVTKIVKSMLPEEMRHQHNFIDIHRMQNGIYCIVNHGEYEFIFSPTEVNQAEQQNEKEKRDNG